MERTKTAWRVVSDPYAPEERWVAACLETDSSSLVPEGIAPKSPQRALTEVVAISALVAALGGAFAGQSTHAMYYLHHTLGQWLLNDTAFEVWGSFYSWFNQPNALTSYIPFFFSYSMGFLSSSFKLQKPALYTNFCMLGCYFIILAQGNLFFGDSYNEILMTTGLVGAVGSFFVGRKIAANLARITRPERVFNSMLWGLAPAVLFVPLLPFLQSFPVTLGICLAVPAIAGLMAAATCGTASPKTARMFSLVVATPFLMAALLHVPVTLWYYFTWPVSESGGLWLGLTREWMYFFGLPIAALALPAIGGLIGSRFLDKMAAEKSPFAPITATETCPLPVAQSVE